MTLNEAYEEYVRTGNLDLLYPYVKQRCLQAAATVLHRTPSEDMVVTLTTNALMDIAKFKPGKSAFSSWVFLDARQNCINELKRGDAPYNDPILDEEGVPHFQRWAFDPELHPAKDSAGPDKWTGRVGQHRAKDALDDFSADLETDDALLELYSRVETVLDSDEQELIRLKFDGYAGAEIAEILDMPQGTVEWKFFELKKKLQKAA